MPQMPRDIEMQPMLAKHTRLPAAEVGHGDEENAFLV